MSPASGLKQLQVFVLLGDLQGRPGSSLLHVASPGASPLRAETSIAKKASGELGIGWQLGLRAEAFAPLLVALSMSPSSQHRVWFQG